MVPIVTKEQIVENYIDKNYSMSKTAKILGVSVGVIHKYIHFFDIPAKKRNDYKPTEKMYDQIRSLGKSWKGKKRDDNFCQKMKETRKRLNGPGCKKLRRDGYVAVYYPTYQRTSKDGFVMEHVLIMEQSIGRSLKDNECVHHINGMRADNRLDNLLLMTKQEHMSYHSRKRHMERRVKKLMNICAFCGRLTNDPNFNYANNEKRTAIARYTIAVPRWGAAEGQQNADFINILAFGKNAEFVQKHFHKGMRVIVTGKMQSGNYTNKDGQKVYTWELLTDNQEFADGKPAEQQNQNQGYQYQQNPTPQTQGYQYQNQPMPNPQYAPVQQTVTQPQMNQNYGYQMPQNPVPTAPPQMANEQFMQIPDSVTSDSLPFN